MSRQTARRSAGPATPQRPVRPVMSEHGATSDVAAVTLAAVAPPVRRCARGPPWGPCAQKQAVAPPVGDWTYQCATLSVPLDRTGRQPGAVTLEVARETEEITDADDAAAGAHGRAGRGRRDVRVHHELRRAAGRRARASRHGAGRAPRAPRIPYRIHAIDLRGAGPGASPAPASRRSG